MFFLQTIQNALMPTNVTRIFPRISAKIYSASIIILLFFSNDVYEKNQFEMWNLNIHVITIKNKKEDYITVWFFADGNILFDKHIKYNSHGTNSNQ